MKEGKIMPLNIDWTVFGTAVADRLTTATTIREMNFSATSTQENATAAVPAGIPIIGTGTAHLRVGGGAMNVIPTFPGALATERGLVAGKIRTLMKWRDFGGVSYFGLMALQSALDMTTGTHNAYVLACSTLFFQNRIHIGQMDNSVLGSWSSLASSPINAFMDGVSLAIEFEWDASSGTSVLLTVRTGSALDFSNLADILSFTDVVNPHVTSVAEGFWGARLSGGVDVYWDDMTIFKKS